MASSRWRRHLRANHPASAQTTIAALTTLRLVTSGRMWLGSIPLGGGGAAVRASWPGETDGRWEGGDEGIMADGVPVGSIGGGGCMGGGGGACGTSDGSAGGNFGGGGEGEAGGSEGAKGTRHCPSSHAHP